MCSLGGLANAVKNQYFEDKSSNYSVRRFCVAPMMEWTDRHCRYFMRLLSRNALLYTEMVTTGALLHGDRARFLAHDPAELPLALQLGGSVPKDLAACAAFAQAAGFSEVNLNVGCPSDRVQNNMIGACLMAHPTLVGECVAAMRENTTLPVTVKCRIGIDAMDSDDALFDFIGKVAERGCETFIVHARIAILAGLSPKENREIPPLNYPRVYRVKQHFPQLEIIINGGITTLDACHQHLRQVDGVMLGREAYHNPWLLQQVDPELFGAPAPQQSRVQALEAFLPYAERCLAAGIPLNHLTRHVLGLFHGQNGGKRFRRHLSERAHLRGATLDTLREALALTQPRADYVPEPVAG
jgi:tRNA-dihydrouridine synthase A